jgi:ABC-type Fe3+-siderophore transport system permease subunit
MEEHLAAVTASGFVLILVADLIGNYLHFEKPAVNAMFTCLIWGFLFTALNFSYWEFTDLPLVNWHDFPWWLVMGVVLAFVSDLLGNLIAFKSVYRNSFVTAVVWAVLFFIVAKIVIWLFASGYLQGF